MDRIFDWAVPPSGLVTVTVRAPAFAFAATVNVSWISDAPTTCVETTSTPPPETVTTAPDSKPLPLTTTTTFLDPGASDEGDADFRVGAAVTLKQVLQDADAPSGFVTVTVRSPILAELETDKLSVIAV